MIPLMRNTLLHESETLGALAEWLATRPKRLSMDAWCAQFEQEFAEWQGRDHAILLNSGASANLAIFQSLLNLDFAWHRRARVGISALTWATNAMPPMQLGMRIVPIDVDPCTLNVMSDTVAPHLPFLDVLFVTNALGYLPDLDVIRDLCNVHNVTLIEDNCESLGSELPSGKAGNFGKASSFSFFVAHHMSTIEGGMVCTDDPNLAEMLRMVRANGWDRNLTADQKAEWRSRYEIEDEFEAKYTFYVPAFNVRPTEITGFLGIQQLQYLDANIAARVEHFEELEQVAARNPHFLRLEHAHMRKLSPFAFPVVCQSEALRDQYVRRFGGAGVEIRPIIAGNIVRQPFYQEWLKRNLGLGVLPFKSDTSASLEGFSLPGADQIERCGFYFGIYPELSRAEIEVLKSCLAGW